MFYPLSHTLTHTHIYILNRRLWKNISKGGKRSRTNYALSTACIHPFFLQRDVRGSLQMLEILDRFLQPGWDVANPLDLAATGDADRRQAQANAGLFSLRIIAMYRDPVGQAWIGPAILCEHAAGNRGLRPGVQHSVVLSQFKGKLYQHTVLVFFRHSASPACLYKS